MDFTSGHHTLTRCLVERALFDSQPFTLIDVGCGCGIPDIWRYFEPSLSGLGIDPQVAECQRLQSNEKNPQVRYIPAFLGLADDHPFRQARGNREPWTGNPWQRTSAARAIARLSEQLPSERRLIETNEWAREELVPIERKLTLDELVSQQKIPEVDFIKIDVDGPDFEVLLSAEKTIQTSPVLGAVLEVNFSGSPDPTDHTFHNFDRQMRRWGFELFDLTTRRYSNLALPAPFRYDNAPHETTFGRIIQGDALYLRDPSGWHEQPEMRVKLSPVKLLKLACLFELFNLPDQAAELLRDQAEVIVSIVDTRPLLHLLAHEINPELESYDLYLKEFEEDPTSFYPSRRIQT